MGLPAGVDLDALFDAIRHSIAAQFPVLVSVRDHIDDRHGVPAPALIFEMSDCEPGDTVDPGTDQLELLATFEADLIIGFRTAHAKRTIRKLATSIAQHIHLNRWGVPCGAAEVVAVEPDAFDPELDQYEVFRIEWRQPIIIGQSIWTNDGTLPTIVLGSDVPDTGPANIDDYTPINP